MISTIFTVASWIALFVFGGLILGNLVHDFVRFVAESIRKENDRARH